MTIEQIAIRQEIRQMLNEADINKNTLKDMVKDVLKEEIVRACKQAMGETDVNNIVRRQMDNNFQEIGRSEIKTEVRDIVHSTFNRMIISVDITDKDGTSCI